jgi:methionyl-tRNA synthetase
MIAKNCDGKIPTPGDFAETERVLLAATDALYGIAREAMDRQGLKHYLDAVWGVVADANRYFASEQPWSKKATDPERMATILYVAAEVVRQVAILAQPVTPAGAAKLLDILAQPAAARTFAALGAAGRLQPGTAIPEPSGVFPRYVNPEESKDKPPKPNKGKPKS